MDNFQSAIERWREGLDDTDFDQQLEFVIQQITQMVDNVHPTEIPAQIFLFGIDSDGSLSGSQAIFGEFPDEPEMQQKLLEAFGKEVIKQVLPVSLFVVNEVWLHHGGQKLDGVAVSGRKISGEKNEAVAVLSRGGEGFSVDHVHYRKTNDKDVDKIQSNEALDQAVRNLYNYIAGNGHGYVIETMKVILTSRFDQRARRN